MAQPIKIDFVDRTITLKLGRIIPDGNARADIHRLLDHALDALATGVVADEKKET